MVRLALPLLLLLGCTSPPPPPAPPAPAVQPEGLAWSAEALWAERALLRSVVDPSALGEARHALSEVVARSPYRTFDLHLAAFVERLAGQPDAEQAILARADPDRASVYAWFFTRPAPEVLALIRAHLHLVCVEQGTDCGPPPPMPEDTPAFEQIAWLSHGADRLAQWTGRPEAPPLAQLLDQIGAVPGARVADVGAGEGWFTFPIARGVGPQGKVYATEIDPSFLRMIRFIAEREGLAQVEAVLQTEADIGLPEGSVDVVLLCEVFKAIATNAQAGDPAHVEARVRPFLDSVHRALAPGGRLVVIDHDSPADAPRALAPATIRALAEAHGFRLVRALDDYRPMQVVLIFERPG